MTDTDADSGAEAAPDPNLAFAGVPVPQRVMEMALQDLLEWAAVIAQLDPARPAHDLQSVQRDLRFNAAWVYGHRVAAAVQGWTELEPDRAAERIDQVGRNMPEGWLTVARRALRDRSWRTIQRGDEQFTGPPVACAKHILDHPND